MKQAFSLVELSIVLVILGLLTGGILTGQSLIRAAELRAVTTEFQTYQTAVNTFRDKYFAIPGDMRNATDFWGAMSTGTCPDATAGTGTETCNGNGNGRLNSPSGNGRAGEIHTFWQHLANAGIIEGTFTGIDGPLASVTYDVVLGENAPRSKLSNAGWAIGAPLTASSDSNFFDGQYSHRIYFGAIRAASGFPEGAVLKPEEAWNIDTKLDDGTPGLGKIRTYKSTSVITPGCASSDDEASATYSLSNDSALCGLILTPGF